MSGELGEATDGRRPLTFSVIEALRQNGYNQTEIANMHGVSRQAVSWHKIEYGGQRLSLIHISEPTRQVR